MHPKKPTPTEKENPANGSGVTTRQAPNRLESGTLNDTNFYRMKTHAFYHKPPTNAAYRNV